MWNAQTGKRGGEGEEKKKKKKKTLGWKDKRSKQTTNVKENGERKSMVEKRRTFNKKNLGIQQENRGGGEEGGKRSH